MFNDEQLLLSVRSLSAANQRLPTVLLLAHLPEPVQARDIAGKADDIGFREMRGWNVVRNLQGAAASNWVVQRPDGWRMMEPGFEALKAAGVDWNRKIPIPPSDSMLPRELFVDTRGYLERVVMQINASYDAELNDCCAVMCRRLVETLIIEIYEFDKRADEIRAPDGNFQMLNGLLSVIFKDAKFNLGRNTKRGLEALKELGDKSAHNRRFNARRPDLDAIQPGLRTAAEELLHLSGLSP